MKACNKTLLVSKNIKDSANKNNPRIVEDVDSNMLNTGYTRSEFQPKYTQHNQIPRSIFTNRESNINIYINEIHYNFNNVRKSKNILSYYSNQVT